MITLTKEQLIASAHARIEFAEMMLAGELEPLKERTWSIELELARIALASLEAEPVAWLWLNRKHPNEVTLVRPEDDEKAEADQWSGWSYKALYADPPVAAAPDYPGVLPCPVMLEPGLRFGKGVPTKAMLGALQRRSEYYAELDAMTPEQRAEHEAGMKEFAAMLQGVENAESPTTMQTAPSLDYSPKNAEPPTGINQGKSEPVTTAYTLPELRYLDTVKFNADCALQDPESIYAQEFFMSLDEVFGERGNYTEPVQAKAVSILIAEIFRLRVFKAAPQQEVKP